MAKIPLRTYNREIEGMIDHGQAAQAIDHCLHILKFFPKHIDTYRLLGKAFLELQKFTEAADVLQRVLACVPDDFISQIGMGIIREDEGNLNAAIWHMERAFESQPSNVGVQDELRRLYGRRDGVQPAKIRLTRGALVRMYARGELYQQAIAEIRVALVEDPQRVDLEALLARMYFLAGQKVDATEVCTRLIGKLPFCFEANRILAEVLPESARAEDAKYYLQRVYAMDPYLAHLSPDILTSAEVPDHAVELERLEWLPDQKPDEVPDWAKAIGAEWTDQNGAIPDWITEIKDEDKSVEFETPEETAPFIAEEISPQTPITEVVPEELLTEARAEEQIPDWMQQAGWEPSSDEITEIPSEELMQEEERATEAGIEDIEQAEIPDWLAALAPKEEPAPVEPEAETPDWIDNILPPEQEEQISEPTPEDETTPPAFEREGEQISGEKMEELPIEDKEEPFEFAFPQSEQPEEIEESLPEFESLEQISAEIVPPEFEAPSEEPVAEPAAEEFVAPDWLANLQAGQPETSAESEAELPSWLEDLSDETYAELPTGAEEPELGVQEIMEEEPAGGQLEEFIMEEPEKKSETEPSANLEDTQPTKIRREEPPTPELHAAPSIKPEPEKEARDTEFDQAMSWLDELAASEEEEVEGAPAIPEEQAEPTPDWIYEISTEESKKLVPSEEIIGETAPPEKETETAAIPEAFLEEAESAAPEMFIEEIEEAASIEEIPGEAEIPTPQEEIGEITEEPALPDAFLEEMPPPVPQAEAEFEEEIAAPADRLEDLLGEEAATEPEAMGLGAPDQFLQAFESLPPESEEIFEQVKEVATEEKAPEITAEPAAEMEEAGLAEEELPDWLKDMLGAEEGPLGEPSPEVPESVAPAEDESLGWLEELKLEEEEEPAAPQVSEEPALEIETPEIPDAFIEEATIVEEETAEIEGLPEWLRGVDEEKLVEEPLEEFKLEEITSDLETTTSESEWEPEVTAEESVEEVESGLEDLSLLQPTVEAEAEFDQYTELLKRAKEALEAHNVERALENYDQLIQFGQHLDDTIHDLRDALYHYPIDVSIWQLLGDAYMKSNQLQDALDAYTKAEELLS